MIERITIEHDICEADEQDVWFVYADGALFKVAYSKTEAVKAVAEVMRREIEE